MRVTISHILAALALSGCAAPAPAEKRGPEPRRVEPRAPRVETAPAPVEESPTVEPEAESEALAEPGSQIPKPRLPRNMPFQETALARTVAEIRGPVTFAPMPGPSDDSLNAVLATAVSREQDSWYQLDDCGRAVRAAHALSYQRTVTGFGVLDISSVTIHHDAEVLWTAELACEQLRDDDTACQGDFVTQEPVVRSVVGPVFSFSIRRVESRACGKPQAVLGARTVDLRTGRPARFDALIRKDSLVAGLVRNSKLRRQVDPRRLDEATTLEDVFTEWRTDDFASFGAYYFAEWSEKREQALMKLWYRVDPSDEEPQELEVWVNPKPEFRSAFEEAFRDAPEAPGR